MSIARSLMSQEINDGVEYLKALKQSSHPQPSSVTASDSAAANHAGQLGSSTQVGERFQGSDKRRSPRYKCEGSAQIREDGCNVHTWATFTDVSLHGCYVEAQATYPVDTVLLMKLECNGVRVETKGAVRVSYPYLGMGIAFTDVTESARAQLKELMGAISRPSAIMGPGVPSALPTSGPLDKIPAITDPTAAVEALIEFFASRHMLTREEFLAVLSKSQSIPTKP